MTSNTIEGKRRRSVGRRGWCKRILRLGGFPEPFLANDDNEARRWRRGHLDIILREDLIYLERVRDVRSVLAAHRTEPARSGSQT